MIKQASTVGYSTYERIKHDIIFGVLAPGSKLKLSGLKTQYSASVSTLRETLNRLASDGFVAAEEQRGFFVTPVSPEDLIEIANLRVLLECHALRESIKNGDTEWEGEVVAAYHKLSLIERQLHVGDETEKEKWKRYDWEFHQALVKSCNSDNLNFFSLFLTRDLGSSDNSNYNSLSEKCGFCCRKKYIRRMISIDTLLK